MVTMNIRHSRCIAYQQTKSGATCRWTDPDETLHSPILFREDQRFKATDIRPAFKLICKIIRMVSNNKRYDSPEGYDKMVYLRAY
jgi:hypothetical protein